MKFSTASFAAFAAVAHALPSNTVKEMPRQASGACSSAVSLDAKSNVWKKYTLHPNNFYRKEIEEAAAGMSGTLKEQALKVADVGSFVWL
jgi:cellulose 1,4-beta-cellobiosidase